MAKFKLEPLDPSKLIKVNNLKEITNPIFFTKFNSPTPDGLLSNEIFGITKADRSQTYAFVNLYDTFIHPAFYKAWMRLDSKVRDCVHQNKKFSIAEGKLVEDQSGGTGIKFLKTNFDKFHFRKNESISHNRDIEFLTTFKDKIFINAMIVIPAYYRDVSTDAGRMGVGDVNKLYNSLIIATRSLKDSSDYGLTMSGAIQGRIQETILELYNWFGSEPQIGKKRGILRRANMSKTTDYSSRLVITCPQLKVETMEDLMVDTDHASVPLASLCVNFFPFILFHLRRFFENEFSGRTTYHYSGKYGEKDYQLKNYQIEFSDDVLKKQIDRFVHGYSNRFIPVEVPVIGAKHKVYMRFKGKGLSVEEADEIISGKKPITNIKSSTIIDRALTWCDLLFMAAVAATNDKTVLITRYPMDSYFNQFPNLINVASTMNTEPAIINGKLYRHYPLIRSKDMLTDTSNTFVDTLNICNIYLDSIGGDY